LTLSEDIPVAREAVMATRSGNDVAYEIIRPETLDGERVFDRVRLLLVDLGGEQSPSDVLRFMLAFDGHSHDLIDGAFTLWS
jgi:hypothetical protein